MTIDLEPLRGLTIFSGLSPDHLRRLAAVLRRRVTDGGTQILAEGERTTSLFILARGRVSTTKRLGFAVHGQADVAKQKLLVHIEAPQVFGEMALLDESPRSAGALAHERCRLLVITKDAFDDLLFLHKDLAYEVLWSIVRMLVSRLRETTEKLTFLSISGKF